MSPDSGSGGSKPEVETPSAGDGGRRVLVVTALTIRGEELTGELREHLGDGAETLILAPALTGSALKHGMGDVDDAVEEARSRLERSIESLRSDGIEARSEVGDSDPILAIEDALAQFAADEIVIVTHPDDEAGWLESDLFDRARQRFEPPIVHLAVASDGAGAGHVTDVETSGAGADPAPDAEVEPESRNLPRFSLREIIGILVAVIGSLVLILLATGCSGDEIQRDAGTAGVGSDGSCVARYVIAGAVTLANMAHVAGLVLFQSVGYRGGWARGFALITLIGTPLAIVASLLVH